MYLKQVNGFYLFAWSVSVEKTIAKGYTKISSKAKNVTLKAAPSNVRSATFDIFLDIFLLNVTKITFVFLFQQRLTKRTDKTHLPV
jgi:hypothetical protein